MRAAKPFDPAEHLTTREAVAFYAEAALSSGSDQVAADALAVIARAPFLKRMDGSGMPYAITMSVGLAILIVGIAKAASAAWPSMSMTFGCLATLATMVGAGKIYDALRTSSS